MGGGSEVAMDAAQMVLLDNSFHSIVVAIESGRLLFSNLRKVLLFLLPAGTFSEIVPVLLNIYFGLPSPLSAFQMIVICILTDLAPSLSMMLEKSEGHLLSLPPRVVGRDRLADKKLLAFAYGFLGVFECFFSLIMFFSYMYRYANLEPKDLFFAFNNWSDGYKGYTIAQLNNFLYTGQTVTFVALVMVQTFGNVYMTRTARLSIFQSLPFLKKFRNLWQIGAQASSVVIMMLMIYVPFIQTIFFASPIPVEYYFLPLGFCVLFVAMDEIRKLLYRKGIPFFVRTAW